MKKLVTVAGFFLLALTVNNTKAQMKNMVGVKGGVSFTSVTDLNGKNRTTGHAGVFYHHELNKSWCIQPEVLYAGAGQRFTNDLGERRVLVTDYIQVPVMVQYFPIKHLFFEAGPQVSWLINAKAKDANQEHSDVISVKYNYRKSDFGINAGAGVNINKNFGLYARYNWGLTDNSKDVNTYMRNRDWQLGASVRF